MSEIPTSSPDTEPRPPLYVDGAPDALQLQKVEELRNAETEYEQKLVDEVDWADIDARIEQRAKAQKEFPELIKEHLKANGIADDDPKYAEYVDLLRDFSIDNIPERAWSFGEVDDDGTVHPALRAGALDKIRERYGLSDDLDVKDVDEEVPSEETDGETSDEDMTGESKTLSETVKEALDSDPDIIAARKDVAEKTEELARLTAARQSRVFDWRRFGGQKTLDEYNAAQDAYEDAVMKLAKLELDAEKAAGQDRDEETLRLDGVFKLVTQYQELQKKTIEELHNTKVGKFVRIMTSGGTTMRIAKGVGLGLLAGGVAAVATGLSGGLAGTAVATTAVGMARFGRAYAQFDDKAGRGVQAVDVNGRMSQFNVDVANAATGEDGDRSLDKNIDKASNYLMELLKEDTKKEQGKRRKSTAFAMGMVAVGGVAGSVIGSVVHGGGPGGAVEAKPGGSDVLSDIGGQENDVADAVQEQADSARDAAGNIDFSGSEFDAARTISPGEGFYQTFQEMDIPASDHTELLEKVGPQLHDLQVDGHPLAYQMPNGEWGIHMTPDGKMPTEALEMINHAHQEMQGAASDAAAESAADTASTSADTGMENVASESVEVASDAPASVDSLSDTVSHSAISDVITHDTISMADVTNNAALMDLSHVATWYPPEAIGQKLGLSAADWGLLQDQIIAQTEQGNRLYTNAFDVQNGYLKFTGNRIPAETMADILNRIPPSTRYGLAA